MLHVKAIKRNYAGMQKMTHYKNMKRCWSLEPNSLMVNRSTPSAHYKYRSITGTAVVNSLLLTSPLSLFCLNADASRLAARLAFIRCQSDIDVYFKHSLSRFSGSCENVYVLQCSHVIGLVLAHCWTPPWFWQEELRIVCVLFAKDAPVKEAVT